MSEPSSAVFHRRTAWNRALTYFAATRPPFLTASVLPVLASGALVAAAPGTTVSGALLALIVVNIALIHCGANVLNDYFDALSGTDAANTARIFPFSGGSRFIQNDVLSAREMRTFGLALSLTGAALGLVMAWHTGPLLLAIGLAGGLIGYFYSAPPCLACRGLGDLSIAVSFGLFPVIGTALILTGSIPEEAWWLGAAIGCFVAAILWANSIPDIASDRATGKWTIPARLGAKTAAWGLPMWFAAGFAILALSPLPSACWIAGLAVIPALMASGAALAGRLEAALPMTIVTHASVTLLLIAGLIWHGA